MKKEFKLQSSAKFKAEASTENPNLGWIEFLLTDNQPNGNKQGIKTEAFQNILDTGLYMPVKMALGEIKGDHSEAVPFGPITSLEASDVSINGKAVVWKDDRADAYKILKGMAANGEPINISWEIFYTTSSEDEDGVEWIGDPILSAATVVGNPSYAGRTQVTSVASQQEPEETLSEGTLLEPVEEMKELHSKFEKLQAEVNKLREYKELREKEDAEATLLAKRLGQLSEAGINLSGEDAAAKRELWLELSEDAFTQLMDVMITSKRSFASSDVPDLGAAPSRSNVEIIRAGLKKLKNTEEN